MFSQGEKCFLTYIYRSPCQSHDDFEDFCTKFDLHLSNINHELPLMLVAQDGGKNSINNSTGQEIDTNY